MNSLRIMMKCSNTQIRGIIEDTVSSARISHILSETHRQLESEIGHPPSSREAGMMKQLMTIDLLQCLIFDIEHGQDKAVTEFKNKLLSILKQDDGETSQPNG